MGNKFKIFLLLIILYEMSMIVFRLDGISVSKMIITSFIWISVILAISVFVARYKKIKTNSPNFAFRLLIILIFWYSINIIRGFFGESASITTLLGNVYTSLAFLTPFVIGFSFKKENIYHLHNYFFKILKLGFLLFPVFFILGGGLLNRIQLRVLILLLLPVVFLMTTINFEERKKQVFIFIILTLLSYIAFGLSNRTMIIREFLLIIGFLALFLYRKFHFKWILKTTYVLLILPLVFIQYSIQIGESAIQQNLSKIQDDELSTDTRTFLYMEVYEDLVENKQLVYGKGANGTYYSNYFSSAEGDSETRLTLEVGVLSLLLKTGLIGVTLYLLLLFISIYFAFFRSHNYYVVGVGLMLFIHVILFFVENIISFSSYNLFVWFFIGVCLSKEVRSMSNLEIKNIINPKFNRQWR